MPTINLKRPTSDSSPSSKENAHEHLGKAIDRTSKIASLGLIVIAGPLVLTRWLASDGNGTLGPEAQPTLAAASLLVTVPMTLALAPVGAAILGAAAGYALVTLPIAAVRDKLSSHHNTSSPEPMIPESTSTAAMLAQMPKDASPDSPAATTNADSGVSETKGSKPDEENQPVSESAPGP